MVGLVRDVCVGEAVLKRRHINLRLITLR